LLTNGFAHWFRKNSDKFFSKKNTGFRAGVFLLLTYLIAAWEYLPSLTATCSWVALTVLMIYPGGLQVAWLV